MLDGPVEPSVELVEVRIRLVRISTGKAFRLADRKRFEIGEDPRRFVEAENSQALPNVTALFRAPTDVAGELGVTTVIYLAEILSQRRGDQCLAWQLVPKIHATGQSTFHGV